VALLAQMLLSTGQECKDAFLVEEFGPFERELAIIAARSVGGGNSGPIVETCGQIRVCCRVNAPAT